VVSSDLKGEAYTSVFDARAGLQTRRLSKWSPGTTTNGATRANCSTLPCACSA